jgi:hypothetical protein
MGNILQNPAINVRERERERHKYVSKDLAKANSSDAVTLANIEGVSNAAISCTQMYVLTNAVEQGLFLKPNSR